MANITRNTHDDTKNYHKVVLQRGEALFDSEGNEAQDNLQVHRVESLLALLDGKRATQSGATGSIVQSLAKNDGWAPVGTASSPPDITLKAGEVFVEGYRLVASNDISLAAQPNINFEATASADTYGVVYADVLLKEITSADDPGIATPQLGETSRREMLDVVFKHSESGTSFNDAWSSISALTPNATDRVWKGNVARVYICRYFRASASTSIAVTDVVDFRAAAGAELLSKMFQATFRQGRQYFDGATGTWLGVTSDGDKAGDGMLAWHAGEKRLILGSLDDDGVTGDDAYRTGGSIVIPMQPAFRHRLQATPSTARKLHGAGVTDGTAVLQNWATDGIKFGDNECLGFLPIAGTNGLPSSPAEADNNFMLTKNGLYANGQTEAVDATPDPSGITTSGNAPDAVIVQRLVVDHISEFEANMPHAWILCSMQGQDLHWFNGHITRGRLDRPVLDDVGGTPVPWDAVVAGNGQRTVSGLDAIERAINFQRDDASTGALGTGNTIKLAVRQGRWELARLLHEWGLSSEFAAQGVLWTKDNNSLQIIGDGSSLCHVSLDTSDNASTTINGLVNIRAGRVVLKGITFQEDISGGNSPRYALHIEAFSVEMEDCVFLGGVDIVSDNIRIKDCEFRGLDTGNTHIIESAAGNPGVAQCLKMSPRTPSPTKAEQNVWDVGGCRFRIFEQAGTHMGVHFEGTLGSNFLLTSRLHHSEFYYDTASGNHSDAPAIQLDIDKGKVEIDNNRFLNANGVVKLGADQTNTAPPFNGDFSGSPIGFPGGAGNTARYGTTAYISCVTDRDRDSSTNVHHNFFDLTEVGENASGRYTLWGAMIVMPHSTASGAGVIIANVSFTHNEVRMGGGNTTWTAIGESPTIWGFYAAPATPDIVAFSSIVFENFNVDDNKFLLGGSQPGNPTAVWRSIMNERISSWPAGGTGYLTDRSCAVGVVLKNQSGGPAVGTGHWCQGFSMKDNQIIQSAPGGANVPQLGTATITDNGAEYWWTTLVLLDQGHYPSANNIAPTLGTRLHQGGGANAYFPQPRVQGNNVFYTMPAGGTQTGISAGGNALDENVPFYFVFSGVYGLLFSHNVVAGGDSAIGDGLACVFMPDGNNAFMNNFFHGFGASGPGAAVDCNGTLADNFASGNIADKWTGGGTDITGCTTTYAGTGDNH